MLPWGVGIGTHGVRRDTFLPIGEYRFEAWRKKRRATDAVIELTVACAVPDVADLAERVREVGAGSWRCWSGRDDAGTVRRAT